MNSVDYSGPGSANLTPGQLFFGKAPGIIHTLLGSCVAITLWHSEEKLGGMCHFLLAQREHYLKNEQHANGYYGTDALRYFEDQIDRRRLRREDFEVKIFGGGNMFEAIHSRSNVLNVSNNNVEEGRRLLEEKGFVVKAQDVGGVRYRKIFFDLSSGDVWVKYGRHAKSIGADH